MLVVVTDSGERYRPAIAGLSQLGVDVHTLADGLPHEEVLRQCAQANVLLVGATPFPGQAIKGLRQVGLMIRCGVGVEDIDVEAATRQGIWVANIPDYCAEEVADHTLLLLLAAARRLRPFMDTVAQGSWQVHELPPVQRLAGRTLGIVGLGRIGMLVASRAHGFGMKVLATARQAPDEQFHRVNADRTDLRGLLAASDAVSLHVPLTFATRHLLDKQAFRQMRRGVIVVNTSRGALIDLDALESALADGTVGAVGLDVLDGEPEPDLSHPVLHRPNVVVTPHVAWYSQEAERDLNERIVANVARYLDGGQPAHLLNPEVRDPAQRKS
jgi:D-3-phosphoglycerate dehydrogenase / 2-oxoglutarate reductase